MTGLRLTPKAFADLDEIWEYIAADSLESADRFVSVLLHKCQMIADMPRMGRLMEEFGESVRCVPVRNYLIFYRKSADGIQVLRVLHGGSQHRPRVLHLTIVGSHPHRFSQSKARIMPGAASHRLHFAASPRCGCACAA